MYKYIVIIYDDKAVPKDVYYCFDSISDILINFEVDNLIQLKEKYNNKVVICECLSLF